MRATRLAKGEYVRARSYFFLLFPEKKGAPPLFLVMLQNGDWKRLPSLSGTEKAALARDMIETLAFLHAKTQEPFWLYQSAIGCRSAKKLSSCFAIRPLTRRRIGLISL